MGMKPKVTLMLSVLAAALAWSSVLPVNADEPSPDTKEVVAGNTAFALNLYGKLRTTDGNLFFSPYSISAALAMTYGGARGQTAEQMARVLQFTMVPTNKLHSAFGALKAGIDSVQRRGTVQLNTANALWPQKGYPFLDDYLDLLKKHYGASITPLDYQGNKEAACRTINHWVEEQTQRKITDLIRPEALNSQTRLVLVNAIYFKGKWASPFKPQVTTEDVFHPTATKEVKCQMMHQRGDFAYAETPDLQILELPYAGGDLSMIVFLPRKTDGIGTLESNLRSARLVEWMGGLKREELSVELPRFKQTSQFSLADSLKNMGMALAFENGADFSGMDGRKNGLFIGAVEHKAYVEVNEEGTEAAAATATTMMDTAAFVRVREFRADHPFIFLIVDKNTGSVLFMGRVMEPGK
jgi:serpin B